MISLRTYALKDVLRITMCILVWTFDTKERNQ